MSPEILSDPEGQFPPTYNRSTFMFRHGLSGHPLLQLPSLIDLAAAWRSTTAAIGPMVRST